MVWQAGVYLTSRQGSRGPFEVLGDASTDSRTKAPTSFRKLDAMLCCSLWKVAPSQGGILRPEGDEWRFGEPSLCG